MSSSAFTPAQRQRAAALYRSLLRTTRNLFGADLRAVEAARQETRRRFNEAKRETDPARIDEGLDMGDQVVSLLRHNVVQGVSENDSNTYRLRFTEHTELGNNESVKQARPPPSLAEIERTCGRPRCSAGLHTLARPVGMSLRHFSSGQRTQAQDDVRAPLPRPVPKFPGIVILADGSSMQLTTTSPRYLSRNTRDYTNHPLWNPTMGHRTDASSEDDTGRLGRFRRRFAEEQAHSAVAFDESDLGWMSGGREARAGSPLQTKKPKGKGRK